MSTMRHLDAAALGWPWNREAKTRAAENRPAAAMEERSKNS
jgi:hypothetical protein